jgi:hypothetical protein
VATVVLVGLLGTQIAGRRVGVLAAAVAAVYPNLWANDGLIMSETFAALGTALVLLFAYRFIRHPTWPNAALAGVMAGLTMLGRGEEVLLLPLLLIPIALLTKDATWARRAGLAGVTTLAVAVTIAPSVVYNLTRFEKPVLLSYGDGGVLLGANCADTYSDCESAAGTGSARFRFRRTTSPSTPRREGREVSRSSRCSPRSESSRLSQ